jgi:ARP2/3 complex 20 kDa subunit (ARPC4)
MEEVDREISEMKLSLNRRARTVAESYLIAVRVYLSVKHELTILPSLVHNVFTFSLHSSTNKHA